MASRMIKAPSRVTRAPKAGKAKAPGPGPVKANADLHENQAPKRGAGPTKTGSNTPVPAKGRTRTSVPAAAPVIRKAKGGTIASRANARKPGMRKAS